MSRPARLLAQAVGLVLIGLVLGLVGIDDRVTDTSGEVHRGRVVSQSAHEVRLRTSAGVASIAIPDARAVQHGLAGAFASLGRHPWLLAAGLLAHLLAFFCTFSRWGVLLAGADLATPARAVFRLGWVGAFFASVIPGGVAGGDVVRSVYIARTHAGRKTRSVLTVFVDRLIGLMVLCGIAAVAVLAAPAGSRLVSGARTTLLVLVGLGGIALLLLFSRRLRRALQLPRLLAKMPFRHVVEEAREAMAIYARRPRTLGVAACLSLGGHLLFLGAFFLYARAMGIHLSLLAVGAAIPIAQMLAAIPGLPGGWGVGDFAMFFFLPAVGVPAGQAVALSFAFRLAHTLLTLPGGFLLVGRVVHNGA